MLAEDCTSIQDIMAHIAIHAGEQIVIPAMSRPDSDNLLYNSMKFFLENLLSLYQLLSRQLFPPSLFIHLVLNNRN